MSFANFMKAAFGVVFGYNLDAAVAVIEEESRRPAASLHDMDCFGYPQPYFSLSAQVPSRTLVAWGARRSGVV